MEFIKVGTKYKFEIIDEIDFFSEDKYYVLSDPFNRKHLLKSDLYKKYNFNKGEFINCNVDKINCQGRVYIEPEHPIYKVGKFYNFSFVRKDKIRNKRGDMKNVLVFKDDLGNEAYSFVNNIELYNLFNEQEINAKVIMIKKAHVYIEINN